MTVAFRNVDALPSDPVSTWPYEALATALERGLVPDWQPVFAEIRREPWGRVARSIERILSYEALPGVGPLFTRAITQARLEAEDSERVEVARRVADAIRQSGLSAGRFAERVGTSASRLSTYAAGKVTPSAAMLVRIERFAAGAGRVKGSRSPSAPASARSS
ncbi:MAG: helix-turn-helix transcriptional regulator [Actinomycetota bacterium]|nr:helix-turn-helix transcriptional regulator [Actinomycetota bacterium]